MDTFAALPLYIGGPIFIVGFVAVAVVGGLLFQRYVPHPVLEAHNEIAGFIFAVIGVIYAVLLAFLAIAVWESYSSAEMRVYDEANQLTVAYRRIDAFPEVAARLRSELRRYTDLIISDEWPSMNHGAQSDRANRLIERVAYEVRHLKVTTATQQDVLMSLIDAFQQTMTDRRDRLTTSKTGLHGFLWGVLFLGAGAVLIFSYLFAFKSPAAQIAMIGLLAFTIALVFYLIAALDYPFRGDVRVGPGPFVEARQVFAEVR